MSTSKLMKVTYYDPKSQIRLLCYADTVVWDTKPTPTLTALRFGGYPERVQGLADAIYGGATIEIEDGKDTYSLKTLTRQYRRELSHDGVYAEATLIAEDDGQSAKQNAGDKDEPDKDKNDEDDDQIQQDLPPRNTYIFCTPGERRELFDAVDQKTAVPMIPEYQDYVLTELQKRNSLLGRAAWYMEQDDLTLGEKNAQFLKLFHEEDQRAVEDWICRNRAEEPYTVPRRDRKSTLLYAVLDRARANGDLREIEPIWDYYLPNKNEPLSPDKDSYLTNYAFSAVSTIDFGCEGIYVELFLEGQFDESGNDRCSIGTFKTLRDDAEACRLMGQLCGVLMYHTAKYVNENLHRYTPKRELEAELHRKSAVTESTSEDSRHA